MTAFVTLYSCCALFADGTYMPLVCLFEVGPGRGWKQSMGELVVQERRASGPYRKRLEWEGLANIDWTREKSIAIPSLVCVA